MYKPFREALNVVGLAKHAVVQKQSKAGERVTRQSSHSSSLLFSSRL